MARDLSRLVQQLKQGLQIYKGFSDSDTFITTLVIEVSSRKTRTKVYWGANDQHGLLTSTRG